MLNVKSNKLIDVIINTFSGDGNKDRKCIYYDKFYETFDNRKTASQLNEKRVYFKGH